MQRAVLDFITGRGWTRIGEGEWAELKSAFPHVTASSLSKAGIEVAQPFRGVDQHDFDRLESSLLELAEIYAAQPELHRFTRDQVIAAKDRARWASRNPRADEATRSRKAEMLQWMLVWLDDPDMFETWVRIRRARMEHNADQPMESGVLDHEHAEKDHIERRTDGKPEDIRSPRRGEEAPES